MPVSRKRKKGQTPKRRPVIAIDPRPMQTLAEGVTGTGTRVPSVGFPGSYNHLVLTPRYPDGDPRNQHGPDGLPGLYRMRAVLSRPGFSVGDEYRFAFGELGESGSSHLQVRAELSGTAALTFEAQIARGRQVEFTAFANVEGFISKIESALFEAPSFVTAHVMIYPTLCSVLSNWAAQLDVPLNIAVFELTEIASGAIRRAVRAPFAATPFIISGYLPLAHEFDRYIAFYREAMNSSSLLYEFLCFFKIIEGIRDRRIRIDAETAASGAVPSRPPETLPMDWAEASRWFRKIYRVRQPSEDEFDTLVPQEARGKKIFRVVNETL